MTRCAAAYDGPMHPLQCERDADHSGLHRYHGITWGFHPSMIVATITPDGVRHPKEQS